MPGIWLATTGESAREALAERVGAASAALVHGADHRSETLVAGPSLHLGFTAHGAYPVRHWKTPATLIVLEGAVYDSGEEALAADLGALARKLDGDAADFAARLTAWLRDRDIACPNASASA